MKKPLLLKIYVLSLFTVFFNTILLGQCPVDFSYQQDAYDYKKVTFSVDTEEVEGLEAFEWVFGNLGNNTQQLHLDYNFPQEGIYEVKFFFTTYTGCSDTIIKNIEIKPSRQKKY